MPNIEKKKVTVKCALSAEKEGKIQCNSAESIENEKDGIIVVDHEGEVANHLITDEVTTSTENPEISTDEVKYEEIEVIPSYNRTTGDVLSDDLCVAAETEEKKQTLSCWNCEGNHNMSDCTKPRDFVTITRNRKLFLKTRTVPNVRYHEDAEQKYAGIKPGVISTKLSKALGLQEWQAPEFIYRMRVLGYPPGWLKEAEVHRAEVSLIDGDGSAMSHPEDEEGEIEGPSCKYEPDKLISFFGFNVPFEDHVEEEGEYYRCPPMQYYHSKDEFERIMKANRADKYKRKKSQPTMQTKRMKRSQDVMEISDIDTSDYTIECISPSKDDARKTNNESTTSETIDLTSDADNTANLVSGDTSNVSGPEASSPVNTSDSSVVVTPRENLSIPLSASSPSTPVGAGKSFQHKSLSKSFSYGIGIPNSSTPCQTPPVEKWSVGISGHIDFDNIPESTGKWDKINKIMNRVRLQMTNLQDENK